MKKKLMVLLSVLLVCGTLFSGCSKDNEEEKTTPATVAVSYSFGISQDYLNLVNLSVTYWNDKGEEKLETVTSTTWKKSFTITQSQKIGYKLVAEPKLNIEDLLTTDSYKLGYEYVDNYWSSTGKGNRSGSSVLQTVPRAKVIEYIEKYPTVHHFLIMWDKENDTFVTE